MSMSMRGLLLLACVSLLSRGYLACNVYNMMFGEDDAQAMKERICESRANANVTCGDYLYNDCKFGTPTQSVHAANINECKKNCDLYADTNCDFFTYNTLPMVDENCQLYAGESLNEFRTHCNMVGGPIRFSNKCTVEGDDCDPKDLPGCDTCIHCGGSPTIDNRCSSTIDTECSEMKAVLTESTPLSPTEDFCKSFCDLRSDTMYYVYYREESTCECYAGDQRDCTMKIVAAHIDPIGCY